MGIESAARATKPDGVVIAVVSGHAHKPFPPRAIEETMAEFRYATARWCEETGDDNPLPLVRLLSRFEHRQIALH